MTISVAAAILGFKPLPSAIGTVEFLPLISVPQVEIRA
jgi:hypothetical protein